MPAQGYNTAIIRLAMPRPHAVYTYVRTCNIWRLNDSRWFYECNSLSYLKSAWFGINYHITFMGIFLLLAIEFYILCMWCVHIMCVCVGGGGGGGGGASPNQGSQKSPMFLPKKIIYA